MSKKQITFNFALSHEMAKRLDAYCDTTGRNESDVVRQLILEFLEGDREVDPVGVAAMVSNETRSSVLLRPATLKAFDTKVESDGLASKSATLSYLLDAFLKRSKQQEERVYVSVPLPTSVMRVAVERAATNGSSLGDLLSEVVQAALRPTPVSKET